MRNSSQHERQIRDAAQRVITLAAANGGAPLGFISDDVELLRDDQADRMQRARASIAETDRILAAAPRGQRTRAAERRRSPAEERLASKIGALEVKAASIKLQVELESLRRLLNGAQRSSSSSN